MDALFVFFLFSFIFTLLRSDNLVYSLSHSKCTTIYPSEGIPIHPKDVALLQFALNLEYLEAEFFLWGALGHGLDVVAPQLVLGGPRPFGVKKANLDNVTQAIITEFGYQEVGHLRAIQSVVGLFPRPAYNLSSSHFAKIIDTAFGHPLDPPFDPYHDSLSYMLASYVIPYVGLVGYVGTNPFLNGYISKKLLAGLLAVESGQDAVIRTYLYERANEVVHPYNTTVAQFTNIVSHLRNELSGCHVVKDEGIITPKIFGAENLTDSNVLSADYYSVGYSRSQAEILSIVYGTGSEHKPGGFLPKGGNGEIAKGFLKKT